MVLLCAACASATVRVDGDLRQWERVTLTFDGPQTGEDETLNPFTDYRLDVTVKHAASGRTLTLPGFYAADGSAAESSATSGNKWRVYFTPPAAGSWTYNASFRTGKDVAIADDAKAGAPGSFDGTAGRFVVKPAPKTAKGVLEYVGKHHLRYSGDGSY
jgi:hypothetical protein